MSEEIELVLDRIYTVPFYPKLNNIPRNKRAKKAIAILKEFAERHMKSDKILIDPEVNELIWSRGMQHPPRKITVRMTKDKEDYVSIFLISEEGVPTTPTVSRPTKLDEEKPISEEELDLDEEETDEE